jgi:cell division cycle 14
MAAAVKYGQIIEYIPGKPSVYFSCISPTLLMYTDRLYLASYTTPPSPDTLFPYPAQQPSRRSPSKRSARATDGPSAVSSDRDRIPPYYFSIDDTLLYNAFHHDFGPLHIGHLYRFAVQFHDILGAPENKNKPVVFWSKADARSEYPHLI